MGDMPKWQSLTRPDRRKLVPSSHQRSELSYTILCNFSRGDQRIEEGVPNSLEEKAASINVFITNGCLKCHRALRSVRVAERLALPTSDHGVAGSNPAGGEILPEPKRRFIAQRLSCSYFHRLEMTEILLKGRKTLTHPSIEHWFLPRLILEIKSSVGIHFIPLYCSMKLSSFFFFLRVSNFNCPRTSVMLPVVPEELHLGAGSQTKLPCSRSVCTIITSMSGKWVNMFKNRLDMTLSVFTGP